MPDVHRRHVVVGALKYFGCSRQSFMEPCRVRKRSYRRQVAMYVSRELGFSYPQIGRTFERDHTTVLHAVQRIGDLLRASDDKVSRDVRGVLECACAAAAVDQAALRAQFAGLVQRDDADESEMVTHG